MCGGCHARRTYHAPVSIANPRVADPPASCYEPPPVPHCRVFTLAFIATLGGCQGKSEPDPPRPPPPVVEARASGSIAVRIVSGHPCRADIDGNELLIGTLPLVMMVGGTRWTGEDGETGITLRKEGVPVVRVRDRQDLGLEVFDPQGAAVLRLSDNGEIANAHGEVLRRAEPILAAIRVGDSVVTGTSDVPLAVLITAPELIPEVRGLAACHRLFVREQARK